MTSRICRWFITVFDDVVGATGAVAVWVMCRVSGNFALAAKLHLPQGGGSRRNRFLSGSAASAPVREVSVELRRPDAVTVRPRVEDVRQTAAAACSSAAPNRSSTSIRMAPVSSSKPDTALTSPWREK